MATPARTSGPAIVEPAQGRGWSPAICALVSVAILWHLAAVILAPLSNPTPTILGDRLRPVFQPYLSATHMDQGYKFFAPDPGPSHLIKYELTMSDGSKQKGVLPDIEAHRPRLYYHRHFMLSEFYNNLDELPPPPTVPDQPMPELDWTRLSPSARQREFAKSYADHLLDKYGATSVSLVLEEHNIPPPQRVAEGLPLNHASLYRQRKLGTFTGAQP